MRGLGPIRFVAILALIAVFSLGTPPSTMSAATMPDPCQAGFVMHDGAAQGASHACPGEPATAPISKDCSQMTACLVLPTLGIADRAAPWAAPEGAAIIRLASTPHRAGRTIAPDLSPPIILA